MESLPTIEGCWPRSERCSRGGCQCRYRRSEEHRSRFEQPRSEERCRPSETHCSRSYRTRLPVEWSWNLSSHTRSLWHADRLIVGAPTQCSQIMGPRRSLRKKTIVLAETERSSNS